MKINDLIHDFEIFVSNEEKSLLANMQSVAPLNSYTDREQTIIENLIKKSLVSKIMHNNTVMVTRNE